MAEHEWSDSRYGRPDVMMERYRSSVPGIEPGSVCGPWSSTYNILKNYSGFIWSRLRIYFNIYLKTNIERYVTVILRDVLFGCRTVCLALTNIGRGCSRIGC